ncbi:CaiB/BaiF CoA-transferase family protein [Tropicibacter sp. Alg240-R139]|uniref:CaiB/BaiF CoA transferase family protein n=1 Tax=Tropicibacter sp. Alg240-R139 TaxID=2305991 RepID=UPI001F072F6E|nr:CaiB/BaiF CoA-transferase family protein [Tropicibacter sp. Alg240-R139]
MAGIGPGPLAGQLLADLGAQVIVVVRASYPADKTELNRRGKQSIAVNLKSPEGVKITRNLINDASIVIERFRPGVTEKLSLGPKDLDEHVIYCRMTGWGQTGPLAHTAGHDINYLSLTGALGAMGQANQPAVPPLNLVADYGGGTMFMVFGLLSAYIERLTSGKGQVVDVSMVDGVSAMMSMFHGFLANGTWQNRRSSNLLDGGAPSYRAYRTKDDKYVSVGPLEPQFFAQLIKGMGLDTSELASQNDAETWPAKHKVYEGIFASETRDERQEIFDGTDACVAPVLTFDEVMDHPQNAARGVLSEIDGVMQARPAPRFSRSGSRSPTAPVGQGSTTDSILTTLGYSQPQINALRAGNVLTWSK